MKNWFISLNGAAALSAITLLSHVWRGYLDAMFVIPVDFGVEATMHIYALIFTLLIGGWGWSIYLSTRGSRGGVIAAFIINALVLVVVPISWLFFYCPADCRAQAGVIFNLANTLNLVFGLLAAVSLGLQLRSNQDRGRVEAVVKN